MTRNRNDPANGNGPGQLTTALLFDANSRVLLGRIQSADSSILRANVKAISTDPASNKLVTQVDSDNPAVEAIYDPVERPRYFLGSDGQTIEYRPPQTYKK